MIPQPATSRIRPETWARMTDEQRRAACDAVSDRNLMTKAARDPEKLTGDEVESLGEDVEMVTKIVELHEDENAAVLNAMSTGAARRANPREHLRRVLAASGASDDYQRRVMAYASDDSAE